MLTHHEVKTILNRLQKNLPIINVQIELPLQSIVNHNARLYVDIATLTVPMSLKSNWHPIPPLRINVPQPVPTTLYKSLNYNVRLLLQVNVVLVRVVKCPQLSKHQVLLKHLLCQFLLHIY